MRVNFNEITAKEMQNYKQGVGTVLSKIAIEGHRKLMQHTLKKGSSIGLHSHHDEHEILYILDGNATIKKEDELYELGSNEFFIIKPNERHSIINKEDDDLVFIGVVYK